MSRIVESLYNQYMLKESSDMMMTSFLFDVEDEEELKTLIEEIRSYGIKILNVKLVGRYRNFSEHEVIVRGSKNAIMRYSMDTDDDWIDFDDDEE